jgi:hypothetical protein
MAHGVTLELRKITSQLMFMRPDEYKKRHCWPDGGCVTGVSDRGTRRNKKFQRARFAFMKQTDEGTRRVNNHVCTRAG